MQRGMTEQSPLLQSVNGADEGGLFSADLGFEPLSFLAEDPGEAMLAR